MSKPPLLLPFQCLAAEPVSKTSRKEPKSAKLSKENKNSLLEKKEASDSLERARLQLSGGPA